MRDWEEEEREGKREIRKVDREGREIRMQRCPKEDEKKVDN